MKNGVNINERKMHNSDNKVRLYDVTELGYVNVLLVGLIPYPGFWQFTILPSEYGYSEEGWEDRLKNLLERAEEQTDWDTRGCSTTCELHWLLNEIQEFYNLTNEEKTAIENFIENNLDNENAKF